MTELWSL